MAVAAAAELAVELPMADLVLSVDGELLVLVLREPQVEIMEWLVLQQILMDRKMELILPGVQVVVVPVAEEEAGIMELLVVLVEKVAEW